MKFTNMIQKGLAEFTIIVLGVLAALAVDEWREQRNLDEREIAAVQRLAQSLEVTKQGLDATLIWAVGIEQRAFIVGPWLGALPQDAPELSDELMARILYLSTIVPVSDFSDDVFKEMQATGDYALIRSTVLRDEIGGYFSFLDRTRSAANRVRRDYADLVRGALPLDFQLEFRSKCLVGGPTVAMGDVILGTEDCEFSYAEARLTDSMNNIRGNPQVIAAFKNFQHDRAAVTDFLLAAKNRANELQELLMAYDQD